MGRETAVSMTYTELIISEASIATLKTNMWTNKLTEIMIALLILFNMKKGEL